MIKSTALVMAEENRQNVNTEDALTYLNETEMIIKEEDNLDIPDPVIRLAKAMMVNDRILKDLICQLRNDFKNKAEYFHISLSRFTSTEKKKLIEIFSDMLGIVNIVHYCEERDLICGKLVHSANAHQFVNGLYMEIALFNTTSTILENISNKYGANYLLRKNVLLQTKDHMISNEIDLLIEICGKKYAIEVKSGKKESIDLEKLRTVSLNYGIEPENFILVSNDLCQDDIQKIQYFCGFSAIRLTEYENKMTKLLERDILKEASNV